MPSVMAIISKSVFEKEHRLPNGKIADPGNVLPIDRYLSSQKRLNGLLEGGDLFLMSVRPGDVLWLVAILKGPTQQDSAWVAEPNVAKIGDVSHLLNRLRFDTGKGINAKPGRLGMSLQTPRTLTDEDAGMLQQASSGASPVLEVAPKPQVAPRPQAAPRPLAKAKPRTRISKADAPRRQSPSIKLLMRADDELHRGRPAAALTALLQAWKSAPTSTLAELIETLGAAVDRSLPTPTDQAQWLDVAGHRRGMDVGRLLAGLDEVSMETLKDRLEVLRALPADPRIPAVAIRAAIRFALSSPAGIRSRAFDIAMTSRDPRLRLVAEGLVAHPSPELQKRATRLLKVLAEDTFTAEEAQILEALLIRLKTLSSQEPLQEAELIAQADSSTAVDSETQKLFEAVARSPSDIDLRLVLGDRLEEQGDDRGEFINLQCARKTSGPKGLKRERELLKENRDSWLHPIGQVLPTSRVRFERGFLTTCAAEFVTDSQREKLIGHPLWNTKSKTWTPAR